MHEIQLSNGLVTKVNESHLNIEKTVALPGGLVWTGRIADRKWHAVAAKMGKFYAGTALHGRVVLLLHRVVMNASHGQIVDHKDRDTLNNTVENLRFVTASQNCVNRSKLPGCTSRFKGVCVSGEKFAAQIKVDGKKRGIGQFATEEEAAIAYDKAAFEAWGEDAVLNFPQSLALSK